MKPSAVPKKISTQSERERENEINRVQLIRQEFAKFMKTEYFTRGTNATATSKKVEENKTNRQTVKTQERPLAKPTKDEEKITSKLVKSKERCKTYVEAITSKPSDFLKIGQIIENRYRIVCKLSEGAFGQIYRVVDISNSSNTAASEELALKIEPIEDDQPNMEAAVMIRFKGCPYCPKLYARGKVDESYHFVVMQLLGKNLTELRKACRLKPSRLSLSATVRLLTQCVRSLEGLHGVGFVHRDVKPSNFTMGAEKKDENRVYLLDFGLARFYRNRDGTIRAARSKAGFRGTVRYSAITAHDNAELSRRDDLWSLFYMYFEMLVGELPWSQMTDRKTVGQMKRHHSPEALSQWIPQETGVYVQYVRKLRYEDKPDYDGVADGFAKVIKRLNIKEIDKFDWQLDSCKQLKHWTVTEDCKKC